MFSLLFTSMIPVLIAHSVRSVDVVATCTVEAMNWTFNDRGQSPCEVANTLIGQCENTAGPFITQLQPGNVYLQPIVFDACSCSTVTYSLVSACAVCQGGNISFWSLPGTNSAGTWSQGCSSNIITDGSYPMNIPAGTSVPAWAYQNISEFFNPGTAEEIAAQHEPDSSLVSSPMTATSAMVSSTTTATSKSTVTGPSATSNPKKGLDTAVLAGTIAGAIAGVICLCLAIFSCVFYYRRKQKDPKRYFEGLYQAPESADFLEFESTAMTGPVQGLYTPYRLYDPADPSTYPPASALNLSMSPPKLQNPSLPDPNSATGSPTSTTTSSTGRPKHTRQYSGESDSTYTRTTGRHTRQHSGESDSMYPQTTSSHSRQSSTDTSSVSTKSLVSPVSSSRSRNFLSGYHPSGIVYRTIRED